MNPKNKKDMGYGVYINEEVGSKVNYGDQPNVASIPAAPSTPISTAQALGLMVNESQKQTRELQQLVNIFNQQGLDRGAKIQLPENFANPDGSKSVDLDVIVLLSAGSVREEIFRFTSPDSTYTRFYKYAVFTDVLLATQVEFLPEINGARTLQYHGNPNRQFRIDSSIGIDLGENSLRSGDIYLEPNQTITWKATNLSASAAVFGIRMVGYVDSSRERVSGAFGG